MSYSFNGRVESGEIWDRYRTLDLKNPDSGLAYCLFNLRALVFTAHVVESNHIECEQLFPSASSPLLSIEEKVENSWLHDQAGSSSSHPPHCESPTDSYMAYGDNAILQALHFYGKYYILYPVGTPADIQYAPYQGQQPVYADLAEFLVARDHFPEDHVLQRVVAFNLRTGTVVMCEDYN